MNGCVEEDEDGGAGRGGVRTKMGGMEEDVGSVQ